jgi:tRNA nucleotidyltransferase/poly(A) polymerase
MTFGIILFIPLGETEPIEIALPRTEVSIGTGYRDFTIISDPFLTIEEDLSRRDATINAIGFPVKKLKDLDQLDYKKTPEPKYRLFIDPFNGISDIREKLWRTVGNPEKRFNEDPTRIMRAFRQCGELDLELESETLKAIRKHYRLMERLIPSSYVRLFKELLRLINIKNSGKILLEMNEIGILELLGFPKLSSKLIKKIDKSKFIIKMALLLEPEIMKTNIKTWINTRQVLATNLLNQIDLNILICIQQFTIEILKAIEKETMIFNLLLIREKIHRLAHKNTNYVMDNVLDYIKIRNDLGLDIEKTVEKMNRYIVSIEELEITGEILMANFGLKGKEIKEVKNEILEKIFLDELENKEEKIIEYLEKKYK